MKQFFLLAITLLISKVSSATNAVNYNERLKEALPGFEMPSQWLQTHPAFRVIGNLYGVGGVDLASYLITSDDGHILINTGCLLYTSPSPRDTERSRMPSSA